MDLNTNSLSHVNVQVNAITVNPFLNVEIIYCANRHLEIQPKPIFY